MARKNTRKLDSIKIAIVTGDSHKWQGGALRRINHRLIITNLQRVDVAVSEIEALSLQDVAP